MANVMGSGTSGGHVSYASPCPMAGSHRSRHEGNHFDLSAIQNVLKSIQMSYSAMDNDLKAISAHIINGTTFVRNIKISEELYNLSDARQNDIKSALDNISSSIESAANSIFNAEASYASMLDSEDRNAQQEKEYEEMLEEQRRIRNRKQYRVNNNRYYW